MSKHTPGPWHIPSYLCGDDGTVADGIGPKDGYDIITCCCCGGVRGDSKEQEIANSRLIVAAPELLEALQGILDEDMEDSKRAAYLGGFVLPDDLRQQARAAIAKAKGEQP